MEPELELPGRKNIRKLALALGDFHRQFPKLDVGQLMILLLIALRPGITAKEIQSKTGTAKSTLSRNVLLLSRSSEELEGGGYMLIMQTTDGANANYTLLSPTARLWAVFKGMSALMGDENGTEARQEVAG